MNSGFQHLFLFLLSHNTFTLLILAHQLGPQYHCRNLHASFLLATSASPTESLLTFSLQTSPWLERPSRAGHWPQHWTQVEHSCNRSALLCKHQDPTLANYVQGQDQNSSPFQGTSTSDWKLLVVCLSFHSLLISFLILLEPNRALPLAVLSTHKPFSAYPSMFALLLQTC